MICTCIRCHVDKYQKEFCKNNRSKSGFSTLCKNCYNKERRIDLDKEIEIYNDLIKSNVFERAVKSAIPTGDVTR